jgi:hypothetical protein
MSSISEEIDRIVRTAVRAELAPLLEELTTLRERVAPRREAYSIRELYQLAGGTALCTFKAFQQRGDLPEPVGYRGRERVFKRAQALAYLNRFMPKSSLVVRLKSASAEPLPCECMGG